MLRKKRGLKKFENEIFEYLELSGYDVESGSNGASGVWFFLDGVRINARCDKLGSYCQVRTLEGLSYEFAVSELAFDRLCKFITVCERLRCYLNVEIRK